MDLGQRLKEVWSKIIIDRYDLISELTTYS